VLRRRAGLDKKRKEEREFADFQRASLPKLKPYRRDTPKDERELMDRLEKNLKVLAALQDEFVKESLAGHPGRSVPRTA